MRSFLFWLGFALAALGGLSALARAEPLAFVVDLPLVGSALLAVGAVLMGAVLARGRTRKRLAGVVLIGVLGAWFVVTTFFAFRTEDVRFAGDGIELAGTLFLPTGEGPHPAVVLVHGSAPAFSTREPYRFFAAHFARNGIAALAYDKRSFGGSGGELPQDYDELAHDAAAACRYLAARSDVDAARVGLWGISEGGWVAPLAAARLPSAAFLVVVSGGGVPPHRTTSWELERRLERAGHGAEVVERALAIQRGVDDAFRGRQTDAGWAALLAVRQEPWFETAFGMRPAMVPARPEDWAVDRVDYRRVLDFSALPTLTKLEIPMLFLYGADDPSVPAAESADAIRAALRGPAGRDAAVEVFPGADHLLMTASHRFADGFLERMTTWMQDRAGLPPNR